MGIMYGMPSLIELNKIEDNVILCKSLGLDFVELNMNMLYCLPENNDLNTLKKFKDKYGIQFTMHFPEEIDFGTFYKEINEANVLLFKRFAIYGQALGMEKINIHLNPGTLSTLPDQKVYSYERFLDRYISNLKQALKSVIQYASQYNIRVCIENVVVPKFLEGIFLQLKEIDGLYFTYDIGHDAKSNYNMLPIYQKLDEKVIHMHMHDYDHHTDHQVLFKGIINLYDRITFAKKNNMTVVIEVKSIEALKKSVENLKIRKFI